MDCSIIQSSAVSLIILFISATATLETH